jgi:hypothetical protein
MKHFWHSSLRTPLLAFTGSLKFWLSPVYLRDTNPAITNCGTVSLKTRHSVKLLKSCFKASLRSKRNLNTNKKLTRVRSLGSCHLSLFGHCTGHAHLFIIVPRLAGANVASEPKHTKTKRNIRTTSNRTVMCLGGFFLDMSPLFVFWMDIFTYRDLVRP